METVLVTGCSGFLGSYLMADAASTYQVVGVYHSNPVSTPDAETIRCDLTRPPFEALEEYNADYVVHCAALTDVDRCENDPALARRLNTRMTDHVATLAAEMDARLIHVSTDAVFDGSASRWSERDTPNPVNVYGETKLDAERVARERCDNSVVARTNFFGREGLAAWMLDQLRSGTEFTGFTDAYFTPLYAGDLSAYLLSLLDSEYEGLLHLGGGERTSKYDFAKTLADVFGYDPSLVTTGRLSDHEFDAPRGPDLSLDVSRARDVLGELMPAVRTSIERMRDEGEV